MTETKSVIISMTEEHGANDIYDRMVGVPDNAWNRTAMKSVVPGTKIYINYKKVGISKVVEAIDYPYIDNTVVEEWSTDDTEKYALRVQTTPIVNIANPIMPSELQIVGIKFASTGNILPVMYAQHSVIPISEEDGNKIERMSSIRYWSTIDNSSRFIHLYEIADMITEALGDDGISYLDTTTSCLPNEWYYSDELSYMIKEGRDIMNSLGIEKLTMPTASTKSEIDDDDRIYMDKGDDNYGTH